MRNNTRTLSILPGAVLTILALGGGNALRLVAKDKNSQVNANDPTVRLYSLLDSKYNGKLDDLILLADVFDDPKIPGQPQQHVIRVDYGKERAFGKLNIHVRTVAQPTSEQLKAYNPKQIWDYAETDTAKFTKTDPGTFGRTGDVYFELAPEGGSLATAPVTPQVQAEYERLVNQYLLPALEKKTTGGS